MTRRLRICWPDRRAFARRDGAAIRVLAVSDEPDRALEEPRNREGLGEIDLVIGCGDLAPDQLAFVADAVSAPLAYVRGNHDTGEGWQRKARVLPEPVASGSVGRYGGLLVAGFSWPGRAGAVARRDDLLAWRDALRFMRGRVLSSAEPVLLFSHAAPRGAGDTADDAYHLGFGAYRFILEHFRPPVWLHGHTPLAACDWRVQAGPTTVVNVTGSVLLELVPE